MYFRLKDSAQSFGGGMNNLRFTLKNPCDCFIFQSPNLFCFELKSVGTTSISFERTKNEKGKVVHFHQIEGLKDFAKYKNIVAGFLFNFRKKDGSETCYFQHIHDFLEMIANIDKKSFNEKDLKKYNVKIVESKKLKVNYRYNIQKLLNAICME